MRSFSARLMSWSRSYEPWSQHKGGNGNFSPEQGWGQGRAGMGGGRAFPTFGRSLSATTCHFTLCCAVSVENSPAKKHRLRFGFGWIFVHTNLDQPQSTTLPPLALAPAEEVIWGWGKQRGREGAGKGAAELPGVGGGFLKPPISQSWHQLRRTATFLPQKRAACPAALSPGPYVVSLRSRRVWRGGCALLAQSCCSSPAVGCCVREPSAAQGCLMDLPCSCRDKDDVDADVSRAAKPSVRLPLESGGNLLLLLHLWWQARGPEPAFLPASTKRAWLLGPVVGSPSAD